MKYLFSTEGLTALASVAGQRALFAFDFDGTLAPIEPRPDAVRTPATVMRLLDALARRRPVAVVSGRRRADLLPRLPAAVRHLVGNHGNEGIAPLDARAGDLTRVCRAWLAQLGGLLAGHPLARELMIEDKGLTLSLHFRLARDRAAVGAWIRELIGALAPPPLVIGGKLVFNLLPPGSLTKFEALSMLAADEAAQAVLFVGDDDTDELVFARAPAHWLTVRVEMERNSNARYFLQQQADVTQLLECLVRHHAPLTADRRDEA